MSEKTIDFTRQHWGHALHGFTMVEARPDSLLQRARDWWAGTRRYSIMCHTQRRPRPGDLIRYRTQRGVSFARVYDVRPCFNPDDMFTLNIECNRALDAMGENG